MSQPLEHLLREAHRRSLWQVTGGYLVAAWLVYEASVSLTEGLGLPAWVPPVALILAALGLPIIVATALVQRGGPLSSRGDAPEELRLEGLEPVAAEIRSGRASGVGGAAEGAEGIAHTSAARRLFTWHKTITGGVLAFAALGVASTGFMGMRAACWGPGETLLCSGELAEDAPLLLADFDSPTPDSDLGDVVTEALRVDLLSSTKVRLVDATRVHEALARMRVDGRGRLDAATARQLALREGYPAILTGEVARLGGGFVLTAHVVSVADGAELAPFRVTARDSAGLIDAVDELSEKVRGRIGESLKSARAGEPLERITTSSMEALRLYSQAARELAAGEDRTGPIRLLEEAVERDPEFAMAWRKLGVERNNVGADRAAADRALARAFALIERLPERERYLTEGSYYAGAGNDDARAITAYERAVDRFGDVTALNNLAILYTSNGELARAEELLRRAMTLGPRTTHYVNLGRTLWAQRRDTEAEALVDSALAAYPGNSSVATLALNANMFMRSWETAESLAVALDGSLAGQPEWELGGQNAVLTLRLLRGRAEPARAAIRRLERAMGEAGLPDAALLASVAEGYLALSHGDSAAATALALRAVRELNAAPVVSSESYGSAVELLARTGQARPARELLALWEADTTVAPLPPPMRSNLEMLIALAEGDFAAVERLLPEVDRECPVCARQVEGDLALRLADVPRARAAYATYDTLRAYRGDPGVYNWSVNLARILETSGRLAEADGDRQAAADYYARFIEQWEHADPALQPRVRAARQRLQALVGAGG